MFCHAISINKYFNARKMKYKNVLTDDQMTQDPCCTSLRCQSENNKYYGPDRIWLHKCLSSSKIFINKDFKNLTIQKIEDFMNNSIKNQVDLFLSNSRPVNDDLENVYSGMAGIALLYNFYANKTNNKNNTRETAKHIIEKCLSELDEYSDSISFLVGKCGICVTAAKIYIENNEKENAKKMIKKVKDLLPEALEKRMPDVLYHGRAGYLYCLLLLKTLGWDDEERDVIIRKVVAAIISSGIQTCENDNLQRTPLMFKCNKIKYLGTSKGLSGILHCLLLAKSYLTEDEMNNLVKPSLDYLLTQNNSNGNLRSSLCNDLKDDVHWCHGASGAVNTFVLAYMVFSDEKYLDAAEDYCDVVWTKDAFPINFGLCHGICGNAYTFLTLFQLTGSPIYLYQLSKFMDFVVAFPIGQNELDYPITLFEGTGGIVYALLDFLEPLKAHFPGF